jgi:hypothetical protein
MAIHPADRFPSILEFSRALEAALTGTVRASRDSEVKRPRAGQRYSPSPKPFRFRTGDGGVLAIRTWGGDGDAAAR